MMPDAFCGGHGPMSFWGLGAIRTEAVVIVGGGMGAFVV